MAMTLWLRGLSGGVMSKSGQSFLFMHSHWLTHCFFLPATIKTGFNSDDHYIYYCGKESLRRNGLDLIVNKESKMQYLGAISKMTE